MQLKSCFTVSDADSYKCETGSDGNSSSSSSDSDAQASEDSTEYLLTPAWLLSALKEEIQNITFCLGKDKESGIIGDPPPCYGAALPFRGIFHVDAACMENQRLRWALQLPGVCSAERIWQSWLLFMLGFLR